MTTVARIRQAEVEVAVAHLRQVKPSRSMTSRQRSRKPLSCQNRKMSCKKQLKSRKRRRSVKQRKGKPKAKNLEHKKKMDSIWVSISINLQRIAIAITR
jgi:hypothetical protein